MAKRKRITTKEQIEKKIKRGIGQGVCENYTPWIKIQDVASTGRATRLKGIKTSRQHEFLSDLERDYFYLLEYSDEVIDIREQFPLLPIELTEEIAEETGIKHPRIKENDNIVMSTDFLITIEVDGEQKYLARTIKYSDDLLDKRTIEKFEIERIYWERKGIDWGIVTEKEISKVAAFNISTIHAYHDLLLLDVFKDFDENMIFELVEAFLQRTIGCEESLRKVSTLFDQDFSLERGTGLAIFKYLAINKIIDLDIYETWNFNTMNNFILRNKEILIERKIM